MTVLQELSPLPPAAFFEVKGTIARKKEPFSWREKKGRGLPDITDLSGETRRLSLALFWSPSALYVEGELKGALTQGELLELFLDTRDLKTSSVMTRFCHHFSFDLMQGEGKELSSFRGEDRHPLADPGLIEVKIKRGCLRSSFAILLPQEVLYGYDPEEYHRIGVCYRFSASKGRKGEEEHFPLSMRDFELHKHPALWASMELGE